MTERHQFNCDRCDKKERVTRKTFSQEYEKPDGWREYDIDHGGVTGHLCEDCWYKYLAVEELFMEREVEKKLDLRDEELQANIKRDK